MARLQEFTANQIMGDGMNTYKIKIHLVKYGTRLGYINLEDLTIAKLSEFISRGYKIEPESVFVNLGEDIV